MADTTIGVTAGSGTSIRAFSGAGGLDQYVRQAMATAAGALNSWTVTTAGQASQIAADVTRVGVLITSSAAGIVYLRFDATIPAPATPAYHWYLSPGDRWEVPLSLVQLAVSMTGSVAGGQILSLLATAA
jgi:hypothetical protein